MVGVQNKMSKGQEHVSRSWSLLIKRHVKSARDFIHGFYKELVYGPGTKHFIRVMISPNGILGTFLLIISIFLAFIGRGNPAYSQAQTLINVLWFVYFYMILALSWNIIGGYAGEIDFGHVLFAGIGIYTEAILINEYNAFTWFSFLGGQFSLFGFDVFTVILPLIVTIFLSGVAAAIVAVIIGIPTLKLKGAYFAIIMLAFSEFLLIVFEFIPIPFYNTHLGVGVNVGRLVTIIPNYSFVVYILIIGVAIVAFIISHYVSYTRLGLALRAIKGSPDGASSIGINVLWTKIQALTISGFIAGLAGAVYVLELFDVTPDVAFNTQVTVQMIIMTLLGGSASVFGPILGSLIVYPIGYILNTSLSGVNLAFLGLNISFSVAYLIVYGLIFVFAVLYLPRGIMGVLENKGIVKRESMISEKQLEQFKKRGDKNIE